MSARSAWLPLEAVLPSELDERRKATRFEPEPDAAATSLQEAVDQGGAKPTASRPQASRPDMSAQQEDDGGYTSRLLKAKKDAFKGKDSD